MKTGKYCDKGGGEQNVIEVDEISNRVLVDYGGGKTVWYGQEDYSTWSWAGEWQTDTALENLGEADTGEVVLDYLPPPEEPEIIEEPIVPEKKKRKRIPAKPPEKKPKPKSKTKKR